MSEAVRVENGRPETAASAPAVSLEDVVKRFSEALAVDGVSLDVRPGEFFSLLGPSGSGKTTCLRMIAGFEHPTSGHILLGGRNVSDLPPFERDVNTVFQDYAHFLAGSTVTLPKFISTGSRSLTTVPWCTSLPWRSCC